MAHPYSHEAQRSQKRRLGALGAKAGKSWGSSSMYKKKSLPGTHAGTQREYTISGGSSRKRADRMAAGGSVGRKRRGHSTTNIIISHAGGQGGTGAGGGGATARPAMPVPAPVPVPRPVPVPAGAAPAGPGPAGPVPVPVRPPMAPGAGPPVAAGGPPPGVPPMRPPGMKAGGAVRKAAKGGFLRDSPGKGYPGFPHSPTTEKGSKVSAHKKGGVVGGFKQGGVARCADGGPAGRAEGGTTPEIEPVISDQVVAGTSGGGLGPDTGSESGETGKKKYSDVPELDDFNDGGGVEKRQFGGGSGAMGSSFGGGQAQQQQQGGLLGPGPGRGPSPAIQGPPTLSGRAARPALPLTVPQPATLGARLQRPAPGMTVGYNKGGAVKKYRDWGKGQTKTTGGSMAPRLKSGESYHKQGKGFADGGSVKAGAGSGAGRLARSGKKLPAKTEL